MRALKQRELGGLAAFLILIWTIIGVPTKVNFKLTAATAGFTTALTTKTYLRKCTNLHINHGRQPNDKPLHMSMWKEAPTN